MKFIPSGIHATDVVCDLVIPIYRGRLLCSTQTPWQPVAASLVSALPAPDHRHYLGTVNARHCFALFYGQGSAPEVAGFQWRSLRSLLGAVSEPVFQLAGCALQITRWYREHQFCGCCGAATEDAERDRARVCHVCSLRFYPRISPCVIGLIARGDECLLAKGTRTPEGMYTTLAGFIEPGESAEQAMAREVFEEVGLKIKNIRYSGSQPWPFPSQLMLGFYADYASGELSIDQQEIIEAQWFHVDALPDKIPPPVSISGRLIQGFIQQVKAP